ncbi:MAG: lytic transglycosylase domain-containing protein [bacterium]|nr:lytic transglycosylase domain-containing protein [bacterium]
MFAPFAAGLGLFWMGAARDAPSSPAEGLQLGLRALEEGAPAEARMRFAEVRERWPVVADHAEQLRIHALKETGEPPEIIAAGHAFLNRHGASPVVGLVWQDIAEAHQALGQLADARAAWREAAGHTEDESEQFALALAGARSWEAEARFAEAAAIYRELWRDRPAVKGSEAAEAGLLRTESRLGRPQRGAEDWAERSARLEAAYHNEAALEACKRALSLAPAESEARGALLLRRASLLFRLRRYPEAVDAFAALPPDPDSRFWHARSLARSGKISESVHGFLAVAKAAPPTLAARARFLAGTLLDDDEPEEARSLFEQVAKHAPAAEQRNEARWRLAWAAYRGDRMADATRHLRVLADDTPDPLDALRARYWLARSQQATAPEQANQALTKLAREVPFTYYGGRAADQIGFDLPGLAPTVGQMPGRTPAGRLPAVRRQRVEILVDAGLRESASLELDALRERVRLRKQADRIAFAKLLTRAERYHDAERLILDYDLWQLAQGPDRGDDLAAWHLAWPRAFRTALEPAAVRHEVEPELVYAVMREESGYRPEILSTVGAQGLTQIMPETGERLAKELGREPLRPRELLLPATNLELGAYYLSRLLELSGGRLSAAIASYNAGPGAVGRWLKRDGGLSDDVWVESIPYRQTRRYVKRVMRSVRVYRSLPAESGS